jgi:histidine triad (HIT) family protein
MSDSAQLCPFCIENDLLRVNVLYQDDLWYITDMEEGSINNAVMAITKRHIETPFEINEQEWRELHSLLDRMKTLVDQKEQPKGYNLGWNIHQTGGQNVAHAHLHLLGRYEDEPLAGKGIRYAFKQPNNSRPSQQS